MSEHKIEMSPEALRDMISSAVATAVSSVVTELRKPMPPSAEELASQQRKQDHRLKMAKESEAATKNKRSSQMACPHQHRNGDTYAVYVTENGPSCANSPGYILCQYCQGRFRPGEFTADKSADVWMRDAGAIYDTNLFLKLRSDYGNMGTM
jgi:hypothetical protein